MMRELLSPPSARYLARFATLAHVGRHAIGVLVLMMLICLIAAGLVDLFFAIPPAIVMLTVAPGGIAEMSLMALAMKADVAMVTANQLVRILLVQFSVPPLYAWLRRTCAGRW